MIFETWCAPNITKLKEEKGRGENRNKPDRLGDGEKAKNMPPGGAMVKPMFRQGGLIKRDDDKADDHVGSQSEQIGTSDAE